MCVRRGVCVHACACAHTHNIQFLVWGQLCLGFLQSHVFLHFRERTTLKNRPCIDTSSLVLQEAKPIS